MHASTTVQADATSANSCHYLRSKQRWASVALCTLFKFETSLLQKLFFGDVFVTGVDRELERSGDDPSHPTAARPLARGVGVT